MTRPLTEREAEVLEALLTTGDSDVLLADAVACSRHTLDHYLQRLRARFGARSTRQLIAKAWRERYAAQAAELAECRRGMALLDRRGRPPGSSPPGSDPPRIDDSAPQTSTGETFPRRSGGGLS